MMYHLRVYYCLMRWEKYCEFRMGLCEDGSGIYIRGQASLAFDIGE